MANWKSPGRAERVVIYEEGGDSRQYWRAEDEQGNVLWRKEAALAGRKDSGEGLTTAELVEAIEASLTERRRATRGRKFRL
ncbi:MAG TPA: hypothetical protein VII53_02020 [Solirubrobacteraceae bacterium]